MKDFLKKLSQLFGNLGIITICAILGAWGGQEKKWLRRFVYPAILTIYALFIVKNWYCLSIYTISIWLSCGYGIPSENPTDKGSFLGRFFYKLFNDNKLWSNICTRGLIGILIPISMLSVPLLQETWITYFIGSVIIIGIWSIVSWRGFGEVEVKLFGKSVKLLWVDITVYGVTSSAILLIIHGWLG